MKKITLALTAFMLLNSSLIFSQPGTLDSSFSKNGKLKTSLLGGASSVAIQSDGKILVESGFSVIRLKQNGTIDKTFGTDGKASTSFEGLNKGYLLALQPDGKIIVAGYTVDNSDFWDVCLARFDLNGLLDSSFGTNGQVKFDLAYNIPTGIAIEANGNILITATSEVFTSNDIIIVRFNANGSFSNYFFGDYSYLDYSYALALQSTGKIIVTGSIDNSFALFRFKKELTPDNSFGTQGKTLVNFAAGYALALQSNDKIIALAGDSILRFTKNGMPDSSFGINGKALKVFGNSIAIQADNKILIAGTLNNGSNNDFAVARYKANGKLDKTFGANGIVTTDFGGNDIGSRLAIQPDGKIVVAGSSENELALARYNGDTSLVNTDNEDVSLNVKAQDLSDVLKIYPNPVQSILNIEFNKTTTVQKRISIYDVSGRLLISTASDGNTQLDVKQLTAGTYLIKINDENGKELYRGKVIKQ